MAEHCARWSCNQPLNNSALCPPVERQLRIGGVDNIVQAPPLAVLLQLCLGKVQQRAQHAYAAPFCSKQAGCMWAQSGARERVPTLCLQAVLWLNTPQQRSSPV